MRTVQFANYYHIFATRNLLAFIFPSINIVVRKYTLKLITQLCEMNTLCCNLSLVNYTFDSSSQTFIT